MLLNKQWFTDEIKKYLETGKNGITASKINAIIRGKFIAIQAYFKKQEKSPIKI